MKRNLFIALAAVGAVSLAQAGTQAAPSASAEIAALKGECAAQYSAAYSKGTPAASNEYQFVYSSGKYKGEAQPGKMLACTENQYAAYLDKADPVRVMNAYPTAAGRPTVKKAEAKPAAK